MQIFNITEAYEDTDDPWSGILSAVEFVILKTENRLKDYSLGQLVFSVL